MSKKHIQTSFAVKSTEDVAIGTTQGAVSSAAPDYIDTVRLVCSQHARVAFGPAAVAGDVSTTQGARLVADIPEYFSIRQKDKVVVISEDGATAGTLNITYMTQ